METNPLIPKLIMGGNILEKMTQMQTLTIPYGKFILKIQRPRLPKSGNRNHLAEKRNKNGSQQRYFPHQRAVGGHGATCSAGFQNHGDLLCLQSPLTDSHTNVRVAVSVAGVLFPWDVGKDNTSLYFKCLLKLIKFYPKSLILT